MKRLAVLCAAGVVLLSASLGTTLHAAGPNRAAVVVRLDSDDVRKMCVAFDEPRITGLELLERSGLRLQTDATSLGTAICSIEGKGCSSDDCFCRYPTFWGYWTRTAGGGDWTFSNSGASDRTVRNGDVDGWSWGRDGEPPPPDLGFDDVCTTSPGRDSDRTASAPDDVDRAPVATAEAPDDDATVARRRDAAPRSDEPSPAGGTSAPSATEPAQTRAPLAQPAASGAPVNYLAFAGFVALFAGSAVFAYLFGRRRR